MLHITKRFPGIIANDDITLQLKRGEIHALLGENGAGKSTLMSVLFGLYQAEEGEIRKNGEVVKINNPNDANDLGIGMVHQHFKLVEVFFSADKINSFSFLKNPKKTKAIAFILMLIPGTPKDLLTYVVPLTPMKLSTFLWLTSLARIPSLFSSTVTGSLAQNENYVAAIITYAITFLVSGLLILWYRKTGLSQKTNEAQKQ